MKIDLQQKPLSAKGICSKRKILEKKIIDTNKNKFRFIRIVVLILLLFISFIVMTLEHDLVIKREVVIAFYLSIISVLLGIAWAWTSKKNTLKKDELFNTNFSLACLMIIAFFVISIQTQVFFLSSMLLIAILQGITIITFFFIKNIVIRKLESFESFKRNIQHEISHFEELDPKSHSSEYIALAKWADNDEVVKHYLKQIADLKRKPTLGEYQAILTYREEKPVQERKINLQKQAQKSAKKLGFS